jgi:hypothetical protein
MPIWPAELERGRFQAHDRGQAFADQREYKLFARLKERMDRLNTELHGQRRIPIGNVPGSPPTPERVKDIRQEQLRLAQQALVARK